MTKAESGKAFLSKWIPYGKSLMNRADALGVDWKGIEPWKLEAAIIFAEEQAIPDEYRRPTNIQKRYG